MDGKGNLDNETKWAKEARTAPPDGGWGWVIVFAVFTGNCLMDGCIGSYGIFYPEILKAFDAGPVVTSMAGSLLPAVYMISSPVVGSLNLRYGSRPVCFVGGCIGGAGLILASLSDNIAVFMITFGVIVGTGIGMNFLPGHVITNNYFEKKRGIAGGIVCAGAGFGVFILAPIFQLILSEYGWRGAMLITSGIFMQLCVCSTLMRPLRKQTTRADDHNKNVETSDMNERDPMFKTDSLTVTEKPAKPDKEVQDKYKITENGNKGSEQEMLRFFKESQKDPLMRLKLREKSSSEDTLNINNKRVNNCTDVNIVAKSLQHIPKDHSYTMHTNLSNSQFIEPVALLAQSQQIVQGNQTDTDNNHEIHTNVKEGLRAWRIVSCDTSIFRNKNYIPLLLGGIFIQMGQFIPNTFLPDYCQTIGLDGEQISIIMAIYVTISGGVNIFGRLSAGCLANLKRTDALWLCNMGMFMCGIGCALFSLCNTFASLCIYAVGVGYFIGYFPPLQILIMVEYLGIDKLSSSLGFLQMAKGPAALFGPPLAGLVYQYSKDYAMSLGFAAILFFLAAGIQSLVPISNMCSTIGKGTKMNNELEIDVH
ncbi:monocarboxylate transporter 4-like isoform X1 [Mercenaria mercenaria]|uniref:monocarboxylate transporter 4-like isoform X1 n=1 Tax=Mercenaria mercenaria TaxID=6596 RepID=UPI001E1DD7BD|nr:monocarboxylate transporter 4-like isoform X1 [Mercenaria mercenaria]